MNKWVWNYVSLFSAIEKERIPYCIRVNRYEGSKNLVLFSILTLAKNDFEKYNVIELFYGFGKYENYLWTIFSPLA